MRCLIFSIVFISSLATLTCLAHSTVSLSAISNIDAESYLNEFLKVFDENMTQQFGTNSTIYAQHTNYEVYVTISTVHGVGIEFFPANKTHFHFNTIDVPVERAIFPNLGFNATLPPTNQSTVTWNGTLNGTMVETGNASNVIIQGGLWVTKRARFTSIDADIRAVVDYFIFKSQGFKAFQTINSGSTDTSTLQRSEACLPNTSL